MSTVAHKLRMMTMKTAARFETLSKGLHTVSRLYRCTEMQMKTQT